MFVFLDKRGAVVAIFRHWSDACVYETANAQCRYQRLDLPDLGAALNTLIGPRIDPAASRPSPCRNG